MREHELARVGFSVADYRCLDNPSRGGDPKVLEHVERRMERAMTRVRVVALGAVPAAVITLRAQDGGAKRRKPRILGQEVRTQSEPEAEMAEVDPLQQVRTVDVLPRRDESIEQTLERYARGWVVFGDPIGDEQEQRPCRGRPTPLRPLAVESLMCQKLCHAAGLERPGSLSLPRLRWLVEQVAHDLPADCGVARKKPLDHGLVARHPGRGR